MSGSDSVGRSDPVRRSDHASRFDRFGRRTFLASSAGVAAGAAGVSAMAGTATGASTRLDHLLENESALAKPTGRIRAQTLTVNGLVDPIGVDPDGVTFAWTVHTAGRSIVQSAYRVILRRTDPGHGATVWDSGPVLSAQQAFLAYPGPTLVSDAAYEWTVRPRGYAEQWGPASALPVSRRGCAAETGRANGCVPPETLHNLTASPTSAPR